MGVADVDVLPYNEAADTAGLAAPNPGRRAEGDGDALEEGTDGETVARKAALKVHLPDWLAIRAYRRNWFERRGSFLLCGIFDTRCCLYARHDSGGGCRTRVAQAASSISYVHFYSAGMSLGI